MLPRFKSLSADWSTQDPIRWRRRVLLQSEHPSVMASVWAKSFANLPALSVFLLLLLCLPPGGGQKKKEVTLQPPKCLFQRILCRLMKGECRLNLPLCVKLVRVSQSRTGSSPEPSACYPGTINATRIR